MKSRKPLIVGNWKMNPQSQKSAVKLFKDVKTGVARLRGVAVVVAPPFPFLADAAKLQSGNAPKLAAQTTHYEKLGAHTGEVSLPMLTSLKVTYVITGHSERRAAGETDEMVNKQLLACLKHAVRPIVCVGEKKRDSHGRYFGHIEKQLRAAFSGVPKTKIGEVVVAYEPIWAIGTGDTATPADAHEMKLFIQKVLNDIYGRAPASRVSILYGGSVNQKNAEVLFTEGAVDGFLIGGASLRGSEFVSIAKQVSQHVDV